MAEIEQKHDGVQRLIDRIREEAVGAGRTQAAAIVEQARAEAAAILEAARRERDELQRKAHREIEVEREAARAAMHTAARDVVLSLKAGVVATFEAHVARLVSDTLRDPALMRTLVLVIAGRVAREVLVGKDVEVVVSALLDEHAPDEPMPAAVSDGILGISRDMLREGVELRASPRVAAGAKVRIVGEAVEVDLSAVAISEMLLAYLTPRFRWILEGAE
jgi:V/A-type H+-transporting ATPase subunit E